MRTTDASSVSYTGGQFNWLVDMASKTVAFCDIWLMHHHAASFVFHGTDVVEVISTTRVSVPPLGNSTRSHGFTSKPEKQLSIKQLLPFYASLHAASIVWKWSLKLLPTKGFEWNSIPGRRSLVIGRFDNSSQAAFLPEDDDLVISGTSRKQSLRDRLFILPIIFVSLCSGAVTTGKTGYFIPDMYWANPWQTSTHPWHDKSKPQQIIAC